MTGNLDQSSEYGVKWSIRFSTPASRVESPRSPRPLMTSICYLRKTGPHNPARFARILHSYCNAVKITTPEAAFAGLRGSPICMMRGGDSDATLCVEDLATIMPDARVRAGSPSGGRDLYGHTRTAARPSFWGRVAR